MTCFGNILLSLLRCSTAGKINRDRIPRTVQPGIAPLLRITSFILVSGLFLILSTTVQAIEGLPGSTWGRVALNVNGLTGSGAMGFVNQGIDWSTLPGGITFNTFAEYRYRGRTKQNEFYNAEGPAIGVELKKASLRFGMDYYWEKFPKWPGGVQYSNNREFYLTGYYDWDLYKINKLNWTTIAGLSGSTWFDLTYDIRGLTGSGAMGYVNQGIDWVTLPGDITFNTYAEYRYRSRTKQKEFYDAQGPAIGLELKKSVFRLGADYYWERFPASGERSNYLEFYFTWYIDWDLKHFMK